MFVFSSGFLRFGSSMFGFARKSQGSGGFNFGCAEVLAWPKYCSSSGFWGCSDVRCSIYFDLKLDQCKFVLFGVRSSEYF